MHLIIVGPAAFNLGFYELIIGVTISCASMLVSRGQTAIILFVGAGKNRVWHISVLNSF